MLPILRIIPVGGVFLAIVILLLALSPPAGLHPPLPRAMMPARGTLIARSDHPESWQLLINAALRRADELNQLRQLADSPVRGEKNKPDAAKIENPQKPPELAGVPANRSDAEPEDATGTIVQSPAAAIPVDIGETSSAELPVIPQKEQPPVILTPERSKPSHESLNVAPEPAPESLKVTSEPAKPARESRKRIVRHSRQARVAAKVAEPVQFNLLAAFFANFSVEQPATKPRH